MLYYTLRDRLCQRVGMLDYMTLNDHFEQKEDGLSVKCLIWKNISTFFL